ncbi:MAG: 5-formyltetrahydrofolate cyclo-ligase [Oscillospiraceae bacterium]|nr:5-formyltetrahydrofolate cyclo-ligase [Oscillospiraceae bacterium]
MENEKQALRRELTALRKALSAEERRAADDRILAQLIPLLNKAGAVFTYVSTPFETDTRRIISYCFEKGIPVAAPVSGDKEMRFYFIERWEELAAGRFNILEPINRGSEAMSNERSLCIVPALSADESGLRLGYGGGYYDRFLPSFRGRSAVISYNALRRAIPAEAHDIRADISIFG